MTTPATDRRRPTARENQAFIRRLLALRNPTLSAAIRLTAEHGPRCSRCGKVRLP